MLLHFDYILWKYLIMFKKLYITNDWNRIIELHFLPKKMIELNLSWKKGNDRTTLYIILHNIITMKVHVLYSVHENLSRVKFVYRGNPPYITNLMSNHSHLQMHDIFVEIFFLSLSAVRLYPFEICVLYHQLFCLDFFFYIRCQ